MGIDQSSSSCYSTSNYYYSDIVVENCHGSFVPLPRKSAKCDDDDDDDDDDDGDAFGSTRWQEEEEIGRPDQTTILLNTADATRWRRRTKAR